MDFALDDAAASAAGSPASPPSAVAGGELRRDLLVLVACLGALMAWDLLGLDLSFQPRFVKRFARLEEVIVEAMEGYAAEVRAGTFPGPEHAFESRQKPKIARLY